MDKKRQIVDAKGQLDGIIHLPLLNFAYHLYTEKKSVFCDWVLLNQAVTEELGADSGGLRQLVNQRESMLY